MSNEPTTKYTDPAAPAITFTTEAALAVRRMGDRLDQIRYWHGDAESGRAGETLARSLASLIGMGGSVYGDRIGDSGLLNLVAHTASGMTVGMVWFREDVRATLARTNPDRPVDEIVELLGPDTVNGMVESGTWSLHS